jgi:hypothetical protein
MKIDSQNGRCRECGNNLDIVDADDATMTVECERGHCYLVGHHAFGDGCMLQVLAFLAERTQRSDT